MTALFKVFPEKGFRNSQFQLVSLGIDSVVHIFYEDQLIQELQVEEGSSVTLLNMDRAGVYSFLAKEGDKACQQTVIVADSIRLGSGVLKQAYVFDKVPFVFLLMLDRLIIMPESNDALWEESGLSPDEIRLLDDQHLLLLTNNGVDSQTGLTLFNFAT